MLLNSYCTLFPLSSCCPTAASVVPSRHTGTRWSATCTTAAISRITTPARGGLQRALLLPYHESPHRHAVVCNVHDCCHITNHHTGTRWFATCTTAAISRITTPARGGLQRARLLPYHESPHRHAVVCNVHDCCHITNHHTGTRWSATCTTAAISRITTPARGGLQRARLLPYHESPHRHAVVCNVHDCCHITNNHTGTRWFATCTTAAISRITTPTRGGLQRARLLPYHESPHRHAVVCNVHDCCHITNHHTGTRWFATCTTAAISRITTPARGGLQRARLLPYHESPHRHAVVCNVHDCCHITNNHTGTRWFATCTTAAISRITTPEGGGLQRARLLPYHE